MSRSSNIRVVPFNSDGSKGPDTMFVVDFFENDELIESRILPGKSIHYARDVSDNWDEGIINIEDSNE